MHNPLKYVLIYILLFLGLQGFSQNHAKELIPVSKQHNSTEQVRMVIDKMYKGMSEKDTSMIRTCFLSEASLETAMFQSKDASTKISSISLQSFLNAIGGIPITTTIVEQIYEVDIKIDENVAMVWAPYTFILNGKISHCGTNVFTLVLMPNGWKIKHIIDTRRNQNCEAKQ